MRSEFDEEYSESSPGKYLEFALIKYLFEHGFKEYSTGPGLNEYKLHWTDDFRENLNIKAYGNTARGRLVGALEVKILPVLKKIRSFLQHSPNERAANELSSER